MPDQTFDYVISGGSEGKDRLNILSDAMYPYTKGLLDSLNVRKGSYFLDCGCGGGNVTRMVAEMIAPDGMATGIDMDGSILKLAEAEAEEKGIRNLRFIVKGIYDLDIGQEFDFVYGRFLLSHLNDPLAALLNMKKAAVPGGVVIAEDVHFSGHFSYPHNNAFQRYLELYAGVVRKRGGDPEMGPRLPDLFKQAGIANISFDVVQPCFNTGGGKWMAYITLEKIRSSIIKEGIASEAEVAEILGELKLFTEEPGSIISLPRVVRVWGTAP